MGTKLGIKLSPAQTLAFYGLYFSASICACLRFHCVQSSAGVMCEHVNPYIVHTHKNPISLDQPASINSRFSSVDEA